MNDVTVDNLWLPTFGDPALHFGSDVTSVGIRFSYNTDSLGYYQYVQTGNAMRAFFRELDQRWYVAQGSGLDTHYPFPKQIVNGNETQRAVDSPGLGPLSQHPDYLAEDHFEMHLMFKPNATGAIWVPLRKRAWNWFGEAVYNSMEYILIDGWPTVAGDLNSTEHPSWNSNLFDGIDDISDFVPQ